MRFRVYAERAVIVERAKRRPLYFTAGVASYSGLLFSALVLPKLALASLYAYILFRGLDGLSTGQG